MTARPDWPVMTGIHTAFLEHALEVLPEVPGVVGVAAGGSFISHQMDAQSDLDFVIAVDPDAWPEILDRRVEIAGELGPLLEAFVGDHVGEPRLLICLYGPPLLHVDLKFVSLADAHIRVEDPVILWEMDDGFSDAFARGEARYPGPDPVWIEDRFWIWVHFLADKIERGEYLNAIEMLTFLRARVLGPLALERAGARPDGVRRLESAAPELAVRLTATVARPKAESLCRALNAVVELYGELRDSAGPELRSDVEREVRRHVAELPERLDPGGR